MTTFDFFSGPAITFMVASSISFCVIAFLPSFAAIRAASFTRFSKSAPVNPGVDCAIERIFTSGPTGLFLKWTFKTSSLPFISGAPT